MTWLKGQWPLPAPTQARSLQALGPSVLLWHCPNRLYFLTVLQTTCSQFCAMKTFLLNIESHPFNYFKHFKLEKHSLKINTGMSCYPLRILFFSKYLQWDVGRMMSSGQIINHPSASMGTGKDPNSVWRRELLDAIRKRPQAIKDHEREKYCQTRLTKHAGRQILNSKGCLNTWTDYHSTSVHHH